MESSAIACIFKIAWSNTFCLGRDVWVDRNEQWMEEVVELLPAWWYYGIT
jgi:hypothetical protein